MPSRPSGSSTGLFGKIFAEQRVYIRTAEKTRYLVIRPSTQLACVIAASLVIGWTSFTTSSFIKNAMDGRATRIQLETISEAYEARLAAHSRQQAGLEEQLNQADLRRDEITARLSAKQERLVETANSLREATSELEVLRTEFETLIGQRRDDQTRIAELETDLADLELAMTRAKTSKANLEGAFESLTTAIDTVISERDEASGKLHVLDDELVRMHTKIGTYEDRQERLISQLEVAAKTSLSGLETIFGRVPVDVDQIMSRARRDFTGAGGLFEPAGEAGDDTWEDGTRVAALLNDLETVSLMRFATDRLPLGNPAPSARHTSGFGPRRDPRGRGRAIHNGYDLAAPRGTPIYATADGIVSFAGRQRGYGLVVKVRHAFGFETFYAHNSRLRVKVGQSVSRGDRIADMGSTGRSTGNHLHYEIRIDKKPVNPRKFIEAPRNVL